MKKEINKKEESSIPEFGSDFTEKEQQGWDELINLIELNQASIKLLNLRGIEIKGDPDSDFTITYNSKSGKFVLTYVFQGVDNKTL